MSYVLTPIQAAAFNQRFNLYSPTANTLRSGTTKTMNGVYYKLVYSNVAGRIGQTPAVAQPSATGRTDEYMVFTFDVLRLNIDQECDDGWAVYDILLDQWYIVQGTAQIRHFRARESTYKLARAEAPPVGKDLVLVGGGPI